MPHTIQDSLEPKTCCHGTASGVFSSAPLTTVMGILDGNFGHSYVSSSLSLCDFCTCTAATVSAEYIHTRAHNV